MPLKALREAGASLNTGNRRAWKGIIRILHEDNELWFRVPKGREMSNPSDKRLLCALQSPQGKGGGEEVQLPGARKGRSIQLRSRAAASSGLA